MNKKIIKLVCKSVMFLARKDEDAFFEWIEKMNCIDSFEGVKDELYLYISKPCLADEELRDLIGLFYRYDIEMQQLAQFLTIDNKRWFFDKKKYWFAKVFGSKAKSKIMGAYCCA